MIDVVFLLLVFFVLSAVFIELERSLDTPLPTDRGIAEASNVPTIPLAEIALFLEWIDGPEGGRCVLGTAGLGAAGGPSPAGRRFRTVTPGLPPAAASERTPRPREETRVGYPHPDFKEVREFLAERRRAFEALGHDLPVTVHFGARVPVQMVVSVLDACKEAGIRDCGLAVAAVD